MSLEFAGQNTLIVVAHQDDESLYFGGLLCELANASPVNHITIACMTEPMPGRKDTLKEYVLFYPQTIEFTILKTIIVCFGSK